MNNFDRNCPKCNNLIVYKNYGGLSYSKKNNVLCKQCRISSSPRKTERGCPKCGHVIKYSGVWACEVAERNNRKCKKCASNDPKRIASQAEKMTGEKNYFYGKTHTEETKLKIIQNTDRSFCKTKEYREKISKLNSGKKNPMYGRSVYSIWIEKYGKEEADKRDVECKRKQSIKSSGKIGQTPHHNCGRGWKGRYKDFYFRSLGELSYVIWLEENNIKWKSAECKEFTILYINNDGNKATYRPDFILENERLIVEIKPFALQNTKNNICKFNAAREFCKNNNYEFLVMESPIILEKIAININTGLIKFSKDFELKFWEFYNKQKSS